MADNALHSQAEYTVASSANRQYTDQTVGSVLFAQTQTLTAHAIDLSNISAFSDKPFFARR